MHIFIMWKSSPFIWYLTRQSWIIIFSIITLCPLEGAMYILIERHIAYNHRAINTLLTIPHTSKSIKPFRLQEGTKKQTNIHTYNQKTLPSSFGSRVKRSKTGGHSELLLYEFWKLTLLDMWLFTMENEYFFSRICKSRRTKVVQNDPLSHPLLA